MDTPDPIVQDRTERWFVRQGLPQLIDRYSAREDVLTRMFPYLGLVVFAELFLVFGDRWTGVGQAIAFLGGLALMAGAFAVVNRWRGRPSWTLPDDIGVPELLLYLVLPAIPTVIGAQGGLTENLAVMMAVNLGVLAVGYVITSWGLVPMLRWSVGQMWSQIHGVITLAMKSLPTLLLFSAFIFLNAEMWQVANDFTLPYFAVVAVLFLGLGTAFVLLAVRRVTVDLQRFHRWDEVRPYCAGSPVEAFVPADDDPPPHSPPLGRRAEWNVALLLFVSQAIQIALVALVITVFYVVFGLLTVRETTLLQWTTAEALRGDADWLWRIPLFGDELVFTRQLVVVSGFIGLVSGLQFAVQVVTDEAYRREFAEGMTSEVREALAVRAVYHRALVTP